MTSSLRHFVIATHPKISARAWPNGSRDCYTFNKHILKDSRLVGRKAGKVPREEKMLFPWTDPESYITKYTLVHEDRNGLSSLESNAKSQQPGRSWRARAGWTLGLPSRIQSLPPRFAHRLRGECWVWDWGLLSSLGFRVSGERLKV